MRLVRKKTQRIWENHCNKFVGYLIPGTRFIARLFSAWQISLNAVSLQRKTCCRLLCWAYKKGSGFVQTLGNCSQSKGINFEPFFNSLTMSRFYWNISWQYHQLFCNFTRQFLFVANTAEIAKRFRICSDFRQLQPELRSRFWTFFILPECAGFWT